MKGRDIEHMSDEEWEMLLDEVAGERAEIDEPIVDLRFTERHNNPTPSGGDYSIAYFYDSERRPCMKDKARYMNIVEYTNDGVRINETYAIL